IGPSSAPKNPPVCTIFFLASNDVFFNTNFRSKRLCRLSCLLCAGQSSTLPTSTFLAHSHKHFINSGLQFFFAIAFLTLGDDLYSMRKYGAYFSSLSDILYGRSLWRE